MSTTTAPTEQESVGSARTSLSRVGGHTDTSASPLRRPRLDWPLLAATIGLGICSLIAVAGATQDDIAGQPNYYLIRQSINLTIGLGLMLLIACLEYDQLRHARWWIYGFLLLSNLAVLGIGSNTRGSQRWIDLPGFQFQPSELGKLLLIAVLAGFIVERPRTLRDSQTTVRVIALALLPSGLVLLQPDLGTAIVYVVIALAILFVAGASWKQFAAITAIGAAVLSIVLVALPAVGVQTLAPYQEKRLTAFLSPSRNPANEGYQQEQSRIAIGAGGKTGRGSRATQTKLNFLPEHHTDFVFAVIGETYGFAGAALVLSLFALLIWRGLRILVLARDLFGALLAGGVVAIVMWQMFINVGMTMGITPITGVPLPLVSYGGSQVLVTLMGVGLLQAVHGRAREARPRRSSKGAVTTP